MTAKRKHHAPTTTDAKLDAIRRGVGVDLRRDKQTKAVLSEVRALRKEVAAMSKLLTRALAKR